MFYIRATLFAVLLSGHVSAVSISVENNDYELSNAAATMTDKEENYIVVDGLFYEPGYDVGNVERAAPEALDVIDAGEVDGAHGRRLGKWWKMKQKGKNKKQPSKVKIISAPNKKGCPKASGIDYYSTKHWKCGTDLRSVKCPNKMAKAVHFWGCGCACIAPWRQGAPKLNKKQKKKCPNKKNSWYMPYDYKVCQRLQLECNNGRKSFRKKNCGCGCKKTKKKNKNKPAPKPAPKPTAKPTPKPTPVKTAKPTSKPTSKPSSMSRFLAYEDDDNMNDIVTVASSDLVAAEHDN
eukprot:CAMPEP_0202458384 /NCGR_PEP_ID=MMETSP1360-20130828/24505_1 /ASSEMBLY_ACC=CAM_ASM_000848 /TAXON_ID=515479 /ORGANISM="Licmophora paradoxa, Strain CCMP2313" /LENGTH=292 /DNA_ID=CAMNT_0049078895 /DNA_START=159 /DNA_END=1037 /DNA_ORIENTATION=-